MSISRTAAGIVGRHVFPLCAILLPAIALVAEAPTEPTAPNALGCELILEGKCIEKIDLLDEQGQTKNFVKPGASVFLPPGQYEIEEIQLQGGYSAGPYYGFSDQQLELSPDKPCRLKCGAPLAPSVTVNREGRLLKMDYQLLDGNGREYHSSEYDNPPTFIVYRGDQQIGSGTFEYG